MTRRGNIFRTRRSTGNGLLRLLCALATVALSLFIVPESALASEGPLPSFGEEGGETGICTEFSESESARTPLYVVNRATLSPCEDSGISWSNAVTKVFHRVGQQVSSFDQLAIVEVSQFDFERSTCELVMTARGLSPAAEHRRLAPRPPRV